MPNGLFHKAKRPLPPIQKDTHTTPQAAITFATQQGCRPWPACRPTTRAESQLPSTACPIPGMGFCHCTADGLGHCQGRGVAWAHAAWGLSSCSKLIAIKLCAISEMHAKVRRESVAGYATDETLVCGPKEHTRWWQRYGRHLQGLLYRLILNSYLSSFVLCWQKHQPLPNRQPTASLRHSRGKGSRQRRLLTSMMLSSITASPHS